MRTSTDTFGSPGDPRLRDLLDAERAAVTVLSCLADAAAVAADARLCFDELRFAAAWLCDGLEKRIPRSARRRSSPAAAAVWLAADQATALPAAVDWLRLVNRTQRSVLARIDGLLAEGLDPDLRTFLEEAQAILARSIAGCDDAIAVLDREREVRRGQ